MTTIEYLGHSGIAVEHDGRMLLCDPWMSPRGAYNASWFQYPEYPSHDLSKLLRPAAVYVSHEHPDHYDPWFLAQLPRDTPVLTGRFHKRRCARKLKQLGFETVVELDGFDAYEIAPGFVVRVAVPSHNCAPHWFDSCAMIHAGERTIFNLNDANPALDIDDLRAADVDVLLAQASPAIWYPLTYTCYDADQKRRLMSQRRESAIESFLAAAKAVQPKLAIPFAGPPCFFDEELADHFLSPESMFPTPPISAERLRQTTDIAPEVLKPGDRLFVEGVSGGNGARRRLAYHVDRTPAYADFDYERDRRAYFERHREEKQRIVAEVLAAIPAAEPELLDRLRRHFVPLIRNNPFFIARINMRVLLEVEGEHGGSWVLDFRDVPHADIVYEWQGEPCQYRFRFDARNVEQVLRGELSWEDLLLSFRFRAHRDPDRYNQHLFTFLKMGDHAALQEITKAEMAMSSTPEDTFELEVGDAHYTVQRFCPHAGSDLRDAEIIAGKIVCPGHRWHFDLASGACTEADYRIYCVRTDSTTSAPVPVPTDEDTAA